jgi:hypothetical protein
MTRSKLLAVVVGLAGLTIGALMPRPLLPPAEAATPTNRTRIECLGYDNASTIPTTPSTGNVGTAFVYVTNLGNGSTTATVQFRKFNGSTAGGAQTLNLAPNETELVLSDASDVARASVTGDNNQVYADGMTVQILDSVSIIARQVNCIRSPGS